MAADFITFNLNQIGFAGGLHDPVAAVIFCAPPRVDYSVINGRFVVRERQLTTVDLGPVIERHNKFAAQLARGE
jgi:cytosine/adenosine deaminase-related metal-dependent hydrolase